ncbi:reverse transcriptase domain-containing protein [Tanacetum coccineum]
MDAMTMKMDAQYKEIQSRAKCNHYGGNHSTAYCNNDATPMYREEEAKFMQTFQRTRFYNDYRDRDSKRDNWRSRERNNYNRDYYQSKSDDKPDHQKQLSDIIEAQHSTNAFVKETNAKLWKISQELISNKHKLEQISSDFLSNETENMLVEVGKFTFPVDFIILEMEEDSKVHPILGKAFLYTADAIIRVIQKQLNLGVGIERMSFSIDFAMKHSYSNDDTCFSIDVIDEILEEDFDALLDEENTEFKSEEEIPLEKITFDTDYKIKKSLDEPPTDLELKPLPDHLEYTFLEELSFFL